MRRPTRAAVFRPARWVLAGSVILLAVGHAGAAASDLATTSGADTKEADGCAIRWRQRVFPVAVVAPSDVRDSLVVHIFAEADAIWRPAGIRFEWHRLTSAEAVPTSWLAVYIDERASALDRGPTVLGWIPFTANGPRRSIYVSRSNVEELLQRTADVDDNTVSTHETLLGRALGRALAHEFGHYLLRSKMHTPRGMMRAIRNAEDFFRASRAGFELSVDQRQLAAMHLQEETTTGGDASKGV